MSITTPVLMPVPFCNSGAKATIPVDAPTTPDEANYASYEAGFPPITMIATEANGIPPRGVDFNGILYVLSTNIQNWNAGVQMKFNSDFCTAIGGYPLGAVLQSNDGASAYVSTIANNTTDFNKSPESIGTSWFPWAGDAAKGSSLYIAVGEGTSDAITATFDPAITGLTNGLVVFVRALASNATTTPTFNPDGLGAATITKGTYQPLAVGDIAGNGYWMILQYDSTQGKWVLQNPATGISPQSSMPVGSVYVQFSGQTDPTTLFGGTWDNVSSTYAGLFFRAEGGAAAAFGETQNSAAPNIAGSFGNILNQSYSGAFSRGEYPLLSNGGSSSGGASVNFDASASNTTYGTADEIRPANSTIRIWKRTA